MINYSFKMRFRVALIDDPPVDGDGGLEDNEVLMRSNALGGGFLKLEIECPDQ